MSGKTIQLPSTVIKRSGNKVPFAAEKIRSAIERAGRATGAFESSEARLLSIQALKVITHRFRDRSPHIEQIQDVVEQVLISAITSDPGAIRVR
jgi:ribonucleoside-triphosphate reductase